MNLPSAFPDDVEVAAERAAANPRLPDLDRTDILFVTIDPPGAMDLDQAMFVERQGDGYRVRYAIADVAAFVRAGDPMDLEANRRGETLYGADSKVPLHPKVLSEGAASLLPDQVRPALLWTIDLDSTGEGIAVDVRRARVMSRARLDYESLQARIDGGDETARAGTQAAAAGGAPGPIAQSAAARGDADARRRSRPGQQPLNVIHRSTNHERYRTGVDREDQAIAAAAAGRSRKRQSQS